MIARRSSALGLQEARIAPAWGGGKGLKLDLTPPLWAQMLGLEQLMAALESGVVVGGSCFCR